VVTTKTRDTQEASDTLARLKEKFITSR